MFTYLIYSIDGISYSTEVQIYLRLSAVNFLSLKKRLPNLSTKVLETGYLIFTI